MDLRRKTPARGRSSISLKHMRCVSHACAYTHTHTTTHINTMLHYSHTDPHARVSCLRYPSRRESNKDGQYAFKKRPNQSFSCQVATQIGWNQDVRVVRLRKIRVCLLTFGLDRPHLPPSTTRASLNAAHEAAVSGDRASMLALGCEEDWDHGVTRPWWNIFERLLLRAASTNALSSSLARLCLATLIRTCRALH